MAYGKGISSKTHDIRAIPMALGPMSASKIERLMLIRDGIIAVVNDMIDEVYSQYHPMTDKLTGSDLDKMLLAVQNRQQGISKVWCEKARMLAKPIIQGQYRRYLRSLFGSIRYVDSTVPKDWNTDRKWTHVPVSIQDNVSESDLNILREFYTGDNYEDVLDLFRGVCLRKQPAKWLNEAQIKIVEDIYTRTEAKFRKASFADDSEAVISIPIDYRMLPQGKESKKHSPMRKVEAFFLEDQANAYYRDFLALSPSVPRGERIRVPVVLNKELKALFSVKDKAEPQSLTLELGKGKVGLRLVIAKPQEEAKPLDAFDTIMGRDFGYKNTISLSVFKPSEPIQRDGLESLLTMDKDRAHEFLNSSILPEGAGEFVERVVFSGKNYLEKMGNIAEDIGNYSVRVDNLYKELRAVKDAIMDGFDVKKEDRDGFMVTQDMKKGPLADKARAFFHIFGQINDHKNNRRRKYEKANRIKKSWFGFLSNREVELAKKHNAFLARENLTIEAERKDSATYKGRAFNNMVNHGARGRYSRTASQKHAWNRIPELDFASFYTSTTCFWHGIVDKAMRKGDDFFCTHCGFKEHADAHAADTLAVYLLLKPKNKFNKTL